MHYFPSFYPKASLLAIVFSDFSASDFSGLPDCFSSLITWLFYFCSPDF